jgi:hypothetical protein
VNDPRLEQHLVIHSAATLALAVLCGAAGGLVVHSWAVGVLMVATVMTLGVLAMRLGPVRRSINRVALAVVEGAR